MKSCKQKRPSKFMLVQSFGGISNHPAFRVLESLMYRTAMYKTRTNETLQQSPPAMLFT